MRKVIEYRHNAQECRKLAGKAQNEEQRSQLLRMGDNWEKLATEREQFVKSYPELALVMHREDESPVIKEIISLPGEVAGARCNSTSMQPNARA